MQLKLIELAEEPGVWLPPEPSRDVVVADGYVVVTYGRLASVHRIRLGADGVTAAVEGVRSLLRGRGFRELVWWVGERSTPVDLASQLAACGFEPDDPPRLTTLAIASKPGGEATAEVRRVETLEDFLVALEIDWEAFGTPAGERVERRSAARAAWPLIRADGRSAVYVASLDGEPVGFGRVIFTPWAGLLLGGATLPGARGRGIYTSLVHARWAEAVERGVPRLVVSAGPMSAPILERLGFERLGGVVLLRDGLVSRGL
jgi:GNAT superfamily N-acetyltransferase